MFILDQAIEKRISVYSQVPVEHGELIQVLRWGYSLIYILWFLNWKTLFSSIKANICSSTGMRRISFTNSIRTFFQVSTLTSRQHETNGDKWRTKLRREYLYLSWLMVGFFSGGRSVETMLPENKCCCTGGWVAGKSKTLSLACWLVTKAEAACRVPD